MPLGSAGLWQGSASGGLGLRPIPALVDAGVRELADISHATENRFYSSDELRTRFPIKGGGWALRFMRMVEELEAGGTRPVPTPGSGPLMSSTTTTTTMPDGTTTTTTTTTTFGDCGGAAGQAHVPVVGAVPVGPVPVVNAIPMAV